MGTANPGSLINSLFIPLQTERQVTTCIPCAVALTDDLVEKCLSGWRGEEKKRKKAWQIYTGKGIILVWQKYLLV